MSPVRSGTELSVATWNVCLGTEFEPILGSGRQQSLEEAARAVLDGVRATRFPDRAEAIARVVAQHRPDVLALQELGRWETGGSGEERVLYSFSQIMQVALQRAGAPYVQVGCVETVSGHLPVDGRTWARFTSCDALLVRQDADVDLSVLEVDQGHYESALTVELAGGGSLPIRRGWSSVDLERGGRKVCVVVTHLDSIDAAVRRDQMHELVAMACRSREPVVILGDLNAGEPDPRPPVEADRKQRRRRIGGAGRGRLRGRLGALPGAPARGRSVGTTTGRGRDDRVAGLGARPGRYLGTGSRTPGVDAARPRPAAASRLRVLRPRGSGGARREHHRRRPGGRDHDGAGAAALGPRRRARPPPAARQWTGLTPGQLLGSGQRAQAMQ